MKRYTVRVLGDPDDALSIVLCTAALPAVGSTIQDRRVELVTERRPPFSVWEPLPIDADVSVVPREEGDSTADLSAEIKVIDLLRTERARVREDARRGP